jgi:hypothetical protein
MDDHPQGARDGFAVDTGSMVLAVTAYTANLKITGKLHITVSTRSSDRRPSDLIRNYPEEHMTLARVKIFSLADGKLLEEPPFIVLNVRTVDLLWAEEQAED